MEDTGEEQIQEPKLPFLRWMISNVAFNNDSILIKLAKMCIRDRDILAYRQDSFLEELDEYSVEVETRKLLSNSIAYMLMVRCGIDSELYLEKEDFRNIRDFHTPELVNLFGTATSDVAEMALAEISDTIRKLQQEQKRNYRTFAQTENVSYTCLLYTSRCV